ncbi:MAG TPA: SIS domain-containing protein [Thermoplasmata archaeon]|nr:SIS domain-containing protein [Thermoplasmata archaeon]
MFDFPGPQVPEPPTGRTRHPYFMHDMIRRQSVAAQATFRATVEQLANEPFAPPGRLLYVGQGTSFHAAWAAQRSAEPVLAASLPRAFSSFDVVTADHPVGEGVTAVVFSASGDTALTIAAQRRLRKEGARVLLITASPQGRSREEADAIVTTQYADETSWAHTVSFTAGLVAAGALLDHWAGRKPEPGEEELVGEVVNAALASENTMLDLVEAFATKDNLLLLGSGDCAPAAREGALKLREAAGRFCATAGVEEFLHGVLPSVGPRSGVIALSRSPTERTRAAHGLAAAAQVGASTLLLDASGGPPGERVVSVPVAPRPPPAALLVIPLQLLAYWMATSEGRNPDVMGLDDPRYLAARSSFGI